MLNVDLVSESLHPRTVLWLEQTDSTMLDAARLAEGGCPSGTVVGAEEQTAGQGRHGRSWRSDREAGLYFSTVLRLPLAPAQQPMVTMAVGLAVAEALMQTTGVTVDLRWPNDIMLNGRKAVGILVQQHNGALITGIGINVNQAQDALPVLPPTAPPPSPPANPARAAAQGVSPVEWYLDALDRTDGAAIANWPVLNQDFDAIAELMQSPVTVMGLADAGAHATQIMDASQPTFFLSHWVRDEGLFGIEEGVRRLTSDTASLIGLTDRGVIRPGAYADINVVDVDGMSLSLPEIVHDFPGGSPRFIQRATGIDHTIVNGRHFMDHGRHTGTLAGRLLRST